MKIIMQLLSRSDTQSLSVKKARLSFYRRPHIANDLNMRFIP